ncbi:MAG: hypothetical protein WC717_03790 [Candidatus Micrarchaeia archaeon]|jgi:hypothetical protein
MAGTHCRARGGFFFAVMALAMLSLVLMTVQVWVKTFEQSDYRASQRFKGEAMRSILASLSDKSLSDFANASAFFATYKMANYTSYLGNGFDHLESGDAYNPYTGRVEKTAIELMVNGSSEPSAGNPINYSEEEKGAYTLAAWQNRTDSAANAMGFDIEFSGAKNIRYYQIDPWTVGVSFELEMNITDSEGTMRQQKKMKAESSFPISGFLDPMITRSDMANRGMERAAATEKQVFKLGMYNVPQDVKPEMADSAGKEGNGWFFGPIMEEYPNVENGFQNLKQYVLVHGYDENLSVYADSYGAVIVTNQPRTVRIGCVERQADCLNCMEREAGGPGCPPAGEWHLFPNNNAVGVPVVVASSEWDINEVMRVTREMEGGPLTEQYVLIDNSYENPEDKMRPDSYHRIWDITRLRDMAICGFYVHGGRGPSFFQRMLANAESIPNPALGIESFVVGKWAGGADDQGGDGSSRLDWEFYGGNVPWDVARIKGMMGCKSKEMCSGEDALEMGAGHFRLSKDASEDYLARDISCSAAGPIAPCD